MRHPMSPLDAIFLLAEDGVGACQGWVAGLFRFLFGRLVC